MKFAAIDIGSNAARLLLCNVYEDEHKVYFKKSSLIRIPLRLGFDAFSKHTISEKKIKRLIQTIKAFKLLIEVHEAISFKAVATAAMREASNGKEIVKRVFDETGISIEIVSGEREANIIFSNHVAEELDQNKGYLYIDVGGGSTEVTLFEDGMVKASSSFNIGTIRLINNQVSSGDWALLKNYLHEVTSQSGDLVAIGSGGNINKLYKMWGKEAPKPFPMKKLRRIRNTLAEMSVTERITQLGMNDDRADVIVHASDIFLFILKHTGIKHIIVPQIGLSDGIIHLLYDDYKRKVK